YDVLEHLPKRRPVVFAIKSAGVLDRLIDAVLAEPLQQRTHPDLVRRRGLPDRFENRKVFGCWYRQRLLLPARIPDALRKMDVNERIANRRKAVAQVSSELLDRQRLDRVEYALLSPIVIVEQLTQVLVIHEPSSQCRIWGAMS